MPEKFIPYGRQTLNDDDILNVEEALRSDWLTQGPLVEKFEQALADYCNARFAVAVANGTAALHLAALAASFRSGNEVITSPNTFVASANCIVYAGATPVFVDIDPRTYCIDPDAIHSRLTPSTRGVIPVHFAGQPCDMAAIGKSAREYGLIVIEDAAHAIGADYQADGKKYKIGSCAHSDMTIFSFHPVKHITTGEGGAITTNNNKLYENLLTLRSHGITKDPSRLTRNDGPWFYQQRELGYNYRITDFQCALGLSQIKRLDVFIERRRRIASIYNDAFSGNPELIVPYQRPGCSSSWHLYVLQFRTLDRLSVFNALREKKLGVNVHYIPVHFQPYYQERFGYQTGNFPKSEEYYSHALTIPLFPAMSDMDVEYVINAINETVRTLKAK